LEIGVEALGVAEEGCRGCPFAKKAVEEGRYDLAGCRGRAGRRDRPERVRGIFAVQAERVDEAGVVVEVLVSGADDVDLAAESAE
jgi:hypothetical protein